MQSDITQRAMKMSSRGRPTPTGPRVPPLACRALEVLGLTGQCVAQSTGCRGLHRIIFLDAHLLIQATVIALLDNLGHLCPPQPPRQLGSPSSPFYMAPAVSSSPLGNGDNHPLTLQDTRRLLTGLPPLALALSYLSSTL